jgi:hypothetical protein
MKRPVGSGMAKLLRAHLAIPLAVSLTLFAQLFFVHASSPQFPTLASTMNRSGIVVPIVVRFYLDASRPNHDTLWEGWRRKGKESRAGQSEYKLSHSEPPVFCDKNQPRWRIKGSHCLNGYFYLRVGSTTSSFPELPHVKSFVAIGGTPPTWASEHEDLLAESSSAEPDVEVEESDPYY